jgi:two-component system response regulator MtrA
MKYKLLIVDDDHFLTDMYAMKFRANGFDVTVSLDGNDTLAKLREGYVPDVALLDMVMPTMDGVEILSQIRKEKLAPQALIIMLTNQNQPSDIEKAKQFAINGYIIKAATIPSEVVAEVVRIMKESGLDLGASLPTGATGA